MSNMHCMIEGCTRHPSKGEGFYRLSAPGDKPAIWVCNTHFDQVEMDPDLRARHQETRDWLLSPNGSH